jgi:hypothetical protein
MIKAMYLLDYIDDASLRGYVQRALNRGEAYHLWRDNKVGNKVMKLVTTDVLL